MTRYNVKGVGYDIARWQNTYRLDGSATTQRDALPLTRVTSAFVPQNLIGQTDHMSFYLLRVWDTLVSVVHITGSQSLISQSESSVRHECYEDHDPNHEVYERSSRARAFFVMALALGSQTSFSKA